MPLLHMAAVILLAVISFLHLYESDMISVLNDEFGYWSNAALVVGYDWKDLAANTPYYSFGYSIFLIPLLMLKLPMQNIYHLALALNSLMLVTGYFCAYAVAQKLTKKKSTFMSYVSALAVTLMCSNLFYSKIAWCETLMTMLMWITVLMIVCLEEKFSWVLYFAAHLVLLLMYLTHQRTLGILMTFTLAMLIILIKHKKAYLIVFTCVSVVLIYLAQKGVRSFQNDLIDNARISNLNDLSVQSEAIAQYTNKIVSQFKDMLLSLTGKLLFIIVATLGVAVIAVKNYLVEVAGVIRKRKFTELLASRTYIVMSFLIMYGLDAVQAMSGSRMDTVVYSRYMEFAIYPLVLLSLISFRELKRSDRTAVLLCISGSALLYYVIDHFVWSNAGDFFNVSCCPVMGAIYQFASKVHTEMLVFYTVFAILLTVVMICVFSCRDNRTCFIFFMILFVSLNVFTFTYSVKWLNYSRYQFHKNTDPVYVALIDEYPDKEIYFIRDDENHMYSPNVKYLQFLLGDREIKVVESTDEIPRDALILINGDCMIPSPRHYNSIARTAYIRLYEFDPEYGRDALKLLNKEIIRGEREVVLEKDENLCILYKGQMIPEDLAQEDVNGD